MVSAWLATHCSTWVRPAVLGGLVALHHYQAKDSCNALCWFGMCVVLSMYGTSSWRPPTDAERSVLSLLDCTCSGNMWT